MKVIVLIGGVEISDQMDRSKEYVLGAFTSSEGVSAARAKFEETFATRRTYFKEVGLVVDGPSPPIGLQ